MALPVLNDTPKYDLKIPSTNKKIKFRPYLIKEEKILMMASESGDGTQMMNAIMDTIQACVQSDVKVDELTTFDIEYLFIKLRSKSVGETSTVNLSCNSCKEPNEIVIDLESIECVGNTKDKFVKLNDEITIEMKYPSYKDFDLNQDENEMGFDILAKSMSAVLTEDSRIEMADETSENIRAFLESMTKEQFEKISSFFLEMPQVKHNIQYNCVKCENHNEIELKGIQSFF